MTWIDNAEKSITEALVKLAAQGSVPAANAALKLLAEERERAAAVVAAAKIEELRADSVRLCRHLGIVGFSQQQAQEVLGEELGAGTRSAFRAGALERKAEIRAIALERARSAGGKIEDWMER